MRALVVTGGTEVDWDDVRVVANRSRGTLGMAIAYFLDAAGVEVTILGSERAFAGPPRFRMWKGLSFRTYDELAAGLDELLAAGPPDFLFMPAAISDFAPVKTSGKVSSTEEEITVTFRRLPKILGTLRERCGIKTFIVGFKMLCGVGEGTLVRAALEQNKKTRINLTVANDVEVLRRPENHGRHPALLVTPEGGTIPVDGTKGGVARQIVELCMRRQATTWARSHQSRIKTPREGAAFQEASDLLGFGQRTGLLRGRAGNVSARFRDEARVWITPRAVDKSEVEPADFVAACFMETTLDEAGDRIIFYEGESASKPSIDTQVHSLLYREREDIAGMLHFHGGYALPDARTAFPWPCGTREEYEEILAAMRRSEVTPPCTVELKDHGSLLCVEPGGGIRLLREWEEQLSQWRDQMSQRFAKLVEGARTSPIIIDGHVHGLVTEVGTFVHFFPSRHLTQEGAARVVALFRADHRVLAIPADDEGLYEPSGYRKLARTPEGLTLFVPDDVEVQESAVGILELDGRVLMLYRHAHDAAYPSALVFPGGRLDPGEDAESAVMREFEEETGLEVAAAEPRGVVTSYSRKAETLHRIQAYQVVLTGGSLLAFPTEEHRDCAWFGPGAPPEVGHATRVLFEDYWERRT